jgi:hypothetical protein
MMRMVYGITGVVGVRFNFSLSRPTALVVRRTRLEFGRCEVAMWGTRRLKDPQPIDTRQIDVAREQSQSRRR